MRESVFREWWLCSHRITKSDKIVNMVEIIILYYEFDGVSADTTTDWVCLAC